MDGMWYKRCPRCNNYMKKIDPRECGMCCACGWEEYETLVFCEVVNHYCTFLSVEGANKISETKLEK